jgi:hypothetical protein
MPGMNATMKEWKAGKLHSGSKTGPKVTSQKQAIAIGLNEQRAAEDDNPVARRKKAQRKAAQKVVYGAYPPSK